ncbi:ROK family transcriptional regulator [Nocardioides marinquilinus]|uniref:ROK family transcriptional regulator n=1 Tax=Nocardioides marinquilinus TaxID=1210400 RepID=A0ABP9PS74_9ACTN
MTREPSPDRVAASGRQGATPSSVRRHNLGVLLERLHLDGPTSRSRLGAATGLTRSTIAELVGELGALGLVTETGRVQSSGFGRPSSVVDVDAPGAVVLAVELAVESVAVAVVGLGGTVLASERVGLPRGTLTAAGAVRRVTTMAGPLLAAHRERLTGVGVAVPGLVRRSDGFVHVAPNLGWDDVPLGRLLGEALRVPVRIEVANEADLGALGEHRRGAGRGAETMVFVSGDVGIGAGLVVDGRPMLGAAGYAGEAGHVLVDPDGRPCTCGSRGCWETEAGEVALLRAAGLDTTHGHAALSRLLVRLDSGDQQAALAVAGVARWVGLGIGNLVNLLNPEVVVLGGFLQQFHRHMEPALESALAARALTQPRQVVRVVPGSLGPLAQLHGAAELALRDLVLDPWAAGAG